MSRITPAFAKLKARGKTGLISFVTAGYPEADATVPLVQALAEGGADLVELGIPFSDPLADGATIQRASFQALRNGITPGRCLEICREVRKQGIQLPLVLMGYYNSIFRYGLESFARDAFQAGADGLIAVDLPPEEAASLRTECLAHDLDLIFLLAPTSTQERIQRVARLARGFIYCVSLMGVTGARTELSQGVEDLCARVRHAISIPLAVGFGVSTRAHVERIGRYADAAVVGSALLNLIETASREDRLEQVRHFVAGLAGT